MKNYLFQGVSYSRTNNLFTWRAAFGKSPKKLRRSLYARYVAQSGWRRNQTHSGYRAGSNLRPGADTGSFVDNKKMLNYVAGWT